jgi:hypothetical protein
MKTVQPSSKLIPPIMSVFSKCYRPATSASEVQIVTWTFRVKFRRILMHTDTIIIFLFIIPVFLTCVSINQTILIKLSEKKCRYICCNVTTSIILFIFKKLFIILINYLYLYTFFAQHKRTLGEVMPEWGISATINGFRLNSTRN